MTKTPEELADEHYKKVFADRPGTLVDEISSADWRDWDCSTEFAVHADPVAEEVVYKNNPTVCVVLIAVDGGIVMIRRNDPNESMYGKMAIPGGFQNGNIKEGMRTAAAREIREELGIDIFGEFLQIMNTSQTDQNGTNLLFFFCDEFFHHSFNEFLPLVDMKPNEVSEVILVYDGNQDTYPIHRKALQEGFVIISNYED